MWEPEESIRREVHEDVERGWGDWKTWMWILLLAGGLLLTTFLIYFFIGRRTMGPEQWNLGNPPTAPDVILF